MRILVTSTPGAGHIHPIAPLAGALAAAGHDVLWATGPDGCTRVAGFGLEATPAGWNSRARQERFAETTPAFAEASPRSRRTLAFGGLFGRVAAPPMRDDLIAVFDAHRPDVIVHDVAELAAVPMARARSIPHVTVAFSGAIPDAVVARAVEEAAPVWAAEGQDVPADLGFFDDLYLHPFPPALEAPAGAATVRTMRPLSADGARDGDAPPEWVNALGRERRAAYVTFGTELGPRAPWADALAALEDLDLDVIATTGSEMARDSIGPVPANVRVEAYVPQRFVLDRVSVVVSHAGAGTILAAAGRGIPQLCLPIAADQFDNADAVARSNAGLALEPDDRQPEAVATAVNRLLDDETFRDAARTVADQLDTLGDPETFVAEIEDLASR